MNNTWDGVHSYQIQASPLRIPKAPLVISTLLLIEAAYWHITRPGFYEGTFIPDSVYVGIIVVLLAFYILRHRYRRIILSANPTGFRVDFRFTDQIGLSWREIAGFGTAGFNDALEAPDFLCQLRIAAPGKARSFAGIQGVRVLDDDTVLIHLHREEAGVRDCIAALEAIRIRSQKGLLLPEASAGIRS